ncbi:hypothetical protein [Singulisphaera acidiphila]|uniref:Carboxypeptidase regulatory-like domain-containing protein n=1 Tax=Singulisphaera acidiphila (strain ATCC BAA-1392 / DSM 18658 / VKM B-2454 / MOB10) TaxID=886293 RepID=L0DLT5_SINAD|nr:hypothetical protein [Singulisphaera acidiphila]AGA30212.1 hypothetical protein Sinac_6107 [Singulisphaera acidiphila DSM 18658]
MVYPRGLLRRRPCCWSLCAAVGLSLVLLGGCGDGADSEKGLIPVAGRITLDGGAWPKPGQLVLIPTKSSGSGEGASRSITAPFDTGGEFTVVGGFGSAKGLHPGEYAIAVECAEDNDEMLLPGTKPKAVKNYVPPPYRDPKTSGLKIVVANQPVKTELAVKSK